MAEVLGTYVVLGDSLFGVPEDAEYIEVTDPDIFERERAGEFDDRCDEMLDGASFRVDVTQLVNIAKLAKEYLYQQVNGNFEGAYEREPLVRALVASRFASKDELEGEE